VHAAPPRHRSGSNRKPELNLEAAAERQQTVGETSGRRFWGSLVDYDRRIVRIVRAAIQRDPTHANR
jgi:hypothetical protein